MKIKNSGRLSTPDLRPSSACRRTVTERGIRAKGTNFSSVVGHKDRLNIHRCHCRQWSAIPRVFRQGLIALDAVSGSLLCIKKQNRSNRFGDCTAGLWDIYTEIKRLTMPLDAPVAYRATSWSTSPGITGITSCNAFIS